MLFTNSGVFSKQLIITQLKWSNALSLYLQESPVTSTFSVLSQSLAKRLVFDDLVYTIF